MTLEWVRRALAVVLIGAGSIAWAQQPPAAQPQSPAAPGAEPPISKDCQTPGVKLVGERPLPVVLEALKSRKVIKILTIGGSASVGREGFGGGYFAVIERVLEKTIPGIDVQIIDRGVSGELARDAAERLRTEVAMTSPDLVLWQLGTSDALAQIPVEEFGRTVGETLAWLKQHNIDVALVGLQYARNLRSDAHYQATRLALQKIAEEHKVLRIGRYEAMQLIDVQGGPNAKGNGGAAVVNEFALTETGYNCLAEYVVRAVTSGVFARRVAP